MASVVAATRLGGRRAAGSALAASADLRLCPAHCQDPWPVRLPTAVRLGQGYHALARSAVTAGSAHGQGLSAHKGSPAKRGGRWSYDTHVGANEHSRRVDRRNAEISRRNGQEGRQKAPRTVRVSQPTRAHLQREVAVGVMIHTWVQMNTLDE